jgi:hypothetical protein
MDSNVLQGVSMIKIVLSTLYHICMRLFGCFILVLSNLYIAVLGTTRIALAP